MVDILHRVGATSSTDDVYRALTSTDGLSAWWASDTTGNGAAGEVLRFRFGNGSVDMKVLEAVPGERVRWEVVDTRGGGSRWSSCTSAARSGECSSSA